MLIVLSTFEVKGVQSSPPGQLPVDSGRDTVEISATFVVDSKFCGFFLVLSEVLLCFCFNWVRDDNSVDNYQQVLLNMSSYSHVEHLPTAFHPMLV